jgi:hypothetical protein
MTIEQTVDIPADHRLTIEVPPEIPAGRAKAAITLVFEAETPRQADERDARRATPISDSLLGIAAGAGNITLDELQAERLSKYLK